MVVLVLECTGPCAILPTKLCIPGNHYPFTLKPESLISSPDIPLSISPLYGTDTALWHDMEREPQTDYDLLLWSKVHQMEGVILPLIDSLKASVDLLVKAGKYAARGFRYRPCFGTVQEESHCRW